MDSGEASCSDRLPGPLLRSHLNWLLLKTLALNVQVPRTLLELSRIVDGIPEILMRRMPRHANPSRLTNYLYRLVDHGYVKRYGLRRRRMATLTPRGKRALEALEQTLATAAWDPGPVTIPLRERIRRQRSRVRRAPYDARLIQLESRVRRLAGQFPRRMRETAFVSYDLPQSRSSRRRRIIATLTAHGFRRMHHSMYAGPALRLRAVLESLEADEVLPRMRWGPLTIFSP